LLFSRDCFFINFFYYFFNKHSVALEVFYSFFATFSASNEAVHVLVNSLNKKPFVQEELHDLCKRYGCLQKIKFNVNTLASEFNVQPDLIEKAITGAIS